MISSHVGRAIQVLRADRISWQPGEDTKAVWQSHFGPWTPERLMAAVSRFLVTNERPPTVAAIVRADQEARQIAAAEKPSPYLLESWRERGLLPPRTPELN